MNTHVFVTALSVFRGEDNGNKKRLYTTKYYYEDHSQYEGAEEYKYIYRGHYQLEPIPMFIRDKMKEEITHVILLETSETWDREHHKLANVSPAPDGTDREWEGMASEWYREWLKINFGDELIIKSIPIDQHKPVKVIEDTMNEIQKLHEEFEAGREDGDTWRLWIDTHGGFRDIALVLISAARYFAVDEKHPIKTDGVFSVYYEYGKPCEIVNQTPFYFKESADALKAFLDYGQYLSLDFTPCDGSMPYAFISYSHDKKFITCVRTIFAEMKKRELLFWFDEEIHVGDQWEDVLEKMISNCSMFICLMNRSYLKSKACWKELIKAVVRRMSKPDEIKMEFVIMEEIRLNHKTCGILDS